MLPIVSRLCHRRPLGAEAERPAPTVPKIRPYKGHASVGKRNWFFLKKFAFPVHLRRLSARFVSLSSKGLFEGNAYSLVIQETTIL